MEAATGIEPVYRALQYRAEPANYLVTATLFLAGNRMGALWERNPGP